MIADTDAELRQRLYTRFLEIDVFSDCVATAGDALEKLDQTPYALVIADVGLPNGGIDQVIGRISRLIPRPIVIVLAATAEATRTLDVEIVQIVLRRPVDLPQLIDLVRSCLRSSASDARKRRSDGEGDGHSSRDQATS